MNAVSLAHETTRRAVRASLAGVQDALAQTSALAELLDIVAHEAAAAGVPNVHIYEALSRGVVIAVHNGAPDFGARCALLNGVLILAHSQLGVLHAKNIPARPFARPDQFSRDTQPTQEQTP